MFTRVILHTVQSEVVDKDMYDFHLEPGDVMDRSKWGEMIRGNLNNKCCCELNTNCMFLMLPHPDESRDYFCCCCCYSQELWVFYFIWHVADIVSKCTLCGYSVG